jgi:hypothetical protein
MIDAIRLRILLVALSGWVNRHQHDIIDYLREENRVLKEHLGDRRLRLTDRQRRRLAATGQAPRGRSRPGVAAPFPDGCASIEFLDTTPSAEL